VIHCIEASSLVHGQKIKNILKTTQEKPIDWSYTQKLTMVVDDPNF
jgi:hypothetical protein